jgi:hypothetical protein
VPIRIFIAVALGAQCMSATAWAGPRVDLIQKRGFVNCGIEENVPGFSEVDAQVVVSASTSTSAARLPRPSSEQPTT